MTTPDPLVTKAYALIENWKQVRARLKTDRDRDETEGLKHTAEAGTIAMLMIDGCIESLTDILPPKE